MRMAKLCTFTSSQALNKIHFRIISLVIILLKNITSKLFSRFLSYEFNVMKENMMFNFFTCNTTLYMGSPMRLSYYMCPYFKLLFDAPSLRLHAQPSRLHFLSLCTIFTSIFKARNFHDTMQRAECLPDIHPDRHADSDLSGREPSWKISFLTGHFSV